MNLYEYLINLLFLIIRKFTVMTGLKLKNAGKCSMLATNG